MFFPSETKLGFLFPPHSREDGFFVFAPEMKERGQSGKKNNADDDEKIYEACC
jgi:hypothetical protein